MEKPHKRLIAWQKSMELVVLIYEITKIFPKDETYGLVSQMRRAAVSGPSNIAKRVQQIDRGINLRISFERQLDRLMS